MSTKNQNLFQQLTPAQGAKVYAKLSKEVTAAGILDRDYPFYAFLISFVFCAFTASLLGIIFSNNPLALSLWCIAFGFFTVQIGGLLHDAGHRTIFKSVKLNDAAGYLFSSIVTISFSNWKLRHNAHHAKPNDLEDDPDIQLPILSFSEDLMRSKKGIERILGRYQSYLYFPMLSLASIAERIGHIFYFKNNHQEKRTIEAVIFTAGIFVWFILPFIVFDVGKAIMIFLVVSATSGFYIGNIFAPNHKGMPIIKKGEKLSFLEQQIVTSRNVKRGLLTDFVYLGLNYQIEHHLFPSCPRNKLKLITPYVKKVCAQEGLEYTETGIIHSNKIILAELSRIALVA
ncbi:MAG: acyl-CoA desaturase [Candidatus Curtissbacteria bacterium]